MPLTQIPKLLRTLTATTASCAVLAAWASAASAQPPAPNKGVANYASYLDKNYAMDAAATLEQTLSSKVLIQNVEIDGQTYLRLQSVTMDSVEAKSLVVRASAAGYSAWYQSAASASEASATRRAPSLTTALTTTPTTTMSAATINTITTPVGLTNANPELAAMLPEGPLLGELFPPRTPVSSR